MARSGEDGACPAGGKHLPASPLFGINCPKSVYDSPAAANALPILFSDRQCTSSLENALSKMAQIKEAEVTST